MRVSHPHVFRDGGGAEDSEENGHVLSSAFVRFLLSVASDYHSFYSADVRVTLTDAERQIIESGLKELTVSSMLSSVVFEAGIGADLNAPVGVGVVMPFVPGIENQNYCTWDNTTNRLYFSAPGLFQVSFSTALFSTPTGDTNFLLQVRRNGTAVALDFASRRAPNESGHVTKIISVNGGDYIDCRYINQGPTALVVIASLASGTWLQVLRYG